MAYFSKLNADKLVIEFAESDTKPIGDGWIETSYPNFICFDYTTNGNGNNLIPVKCHDEAVLNNKCLWDCTNRDHQVKEINA